MPASTWLEYFLLFVRLACLFLTWNVCRSFFANSIHCSAQLKLCFLQLLTKQENQNAKVLFSGTYPKSGYSVLFWGVLYALIQVLISRYSFLRKRVIVLICEWHRSNLPSNLHPKNVLRFLRLRTGFRMTCPRATNGLSACQ